MSIDEGVAAFLQSLDKPPRMTITTMEWATGAGRSPPTAEDEPDLLAAPMGHGHDDDLEIVDLLGRGGMGVVHAARQASLAREVALKVPHDDAPAHQCQALVAEARTTGMLEHPNIPPVHSLWASDKGLPVLVMKRIRGVPWSDLIEDPEHEAWASTKHRDDPPLVRHVKLLEDVCDALHYAHSKGIVHRDLKPENVMVGAFGEVYLLDWGIAIAMDELAAQDEPMVVGTPTHMAPEMTEGEADVRSDVFLCGAVLHEVLTGRPLYDGSSLYYVLMKAATCEPQRYGDDLPEGLVAICRKATAREPDDRYQTVAELQVALGTWLRRRGAEELAAEAQRRLEAAAEGAGGAGELLIEAHFGFVQALREWPEHPRARSGLEACQLARARHALDRGQLELAEALLAEVEHPSEALRAEIEALRDEAARQAELHTRAQELDLATSQRERVAIGVALVAMGTFLWGLSFAFDETPTVGPQDVAYPALALGGLGIGALFYWQRIARNQVSRQWLLTVVATLFGWLLCRLIGWVHGLHIAEVLSFDLVVLSLGAGLFSLWTARWIAPGLIVNAIAIAILAVRPDLHTAAFLFAFLGSSAWLALGWTLGWGQRAPLRAD